LALQRPLVPGVYWLNINDPGFPFMALIQHTEFRDPNEYGERHLVYLGNYRRMDDALLTMPTEEVLEHFAPAIRKINPDFNDGWITQAWSFAAPFAQPIVTTDYRKHIPPFDTPLAGLFVGNMFQVYPHDRGQNYSVRLAEDLARHLIGHEPIR
jgi:protoporphyrinogen oxidase